MTRLDKSEVISNIYFAHALVEASGPAGAQDSDGRVYVIPSLFLGHPLDETGKTVLGFGIYSPFGLGSKWDDDDTRGWVMAAGKGFGDMSTKLSEIQLVNFNPVIARQVTDKLSLAFGIDYYWTRAINRGWMNYAPLGAPGEVDLDLEGDGWGYNLGLQWECTDTVTFGFVARSQVEVDYEGDLDRDNVPGLVPGSPTITSEADTEIIYPWSLAAGLSWEATPQLRMELAAEWMEWSEWDRRVVNTDDPLLGPSFALNLDWKDSWIVMFGTEYDVNEKWTVRGGCGFNETPVRDTRSDVDLPTGDTYVVTGGATYRASEALSFEAGLNLAYGRKRTLDNSSAPAGTEFDALSIYVSLGATYRF